MSESSDPSFSTTEALVKSLRNDLGQMARLLAEAAGYAREAQATLWEIDRRMKDPRP